MGLEPSILGPREGSGFLGKCTTRRTPTSYKWSYNAIDRGYNPNYPFIKPFIGVISPFRTGRGPPCRVSGWKLVTILSKLVYFTYLWDEINLLRLG